MHRDFWTGADTSVKDKGRGRQKSFSVDNDTALIMSLMLLLGTEKTDPILLLALLYILS